MGTNEYAQKLHKMTNTKNQTARVYQDWSMTGFQGWLCVSTHTQYTGTLW